MEKARLGSADRHVLHLGNLGEGQALDKEELGGEPLVMRQGIECLPDLQFLVGRVCLACLTFEEPVEPLAVLLGRAQCKYAVADNAWTVDHQGKTIL